MATLVNQLQGVGNNTTNRNSDNVSELKNELKQLKIAIDESDTREKFPLDSK